MRQLQRAQLPILWWTEPMQPGMTVRVHQLILLLISSTDAFRIRQGKTSPLSFLECHCLARRLTLSTRMYRSVTAKPASASRTRPILFQPLRLQMLFAGLSSQCCHWQQSRMSSAAWPVCCSDVLLVCSPPLCCSPQPLPPQLAIRLGITLKT